MGYSVNLAHHTKDRVGANFYNLLTLVKMMDISDTMCVILCLNYLYRDVMIIYMALRVVRIIQPLNIISQNY